MLGLLVATLFVGALGQTALEAEIVSQGYQAQTHHVTTADGYILELHRIPFGKGETSSNSTRRAVLLMHGAPYCSDSFIHLGSKYAIAYNLADAGYDIWMGNARGNKYSRRHVSLNPDKDIKQFFDFTYEEIGLYDLPAMIDYVLATTNQTKLHYVGHSLGGSSFFVLNSMNTTYQSKFADVHLLAAIGNEKNFPNEDMKYLADGTDIIYELLLFTENMELEPISMTSKFLKSLVNTTVPDDLFGGTSVKQIAHWFQNIRDQSFRRWNYGVAGNLLKYGTKTPPAYDLSKIELNVTLHFSAGDTTLSEDDAQDPIFFLHHAFIDRIASQFGNLDYFMRNDVKELVTSAINQGFNSYSWCTPLPGRPYGC